MAEKKIELDVDFIGVQEGLTKEEEKALSDFFKKQKLVFIKRQGKSIAKPLKNDKAKS